MTDEIKKLINEYIERKYKGLAFNDINKQGFQDAVELLSEYIEAVEFYEDEENWQEPDNHVPYWTLWEDGNHIGHHKARQARTNLIAKLRGEK